MQNRLQQQIDFLIEIDRVKQIFRKSKLIDKSRYENDAEHSWHFAMYAFILAEYSNEQQIDLLKVFKMILIHDVVEIDAGDTFVYDEQGLADKAEREQLAAERIFGLLPQDQNQELYQLWREFEDRATPEAKYAASLDRLQPILQNYYTEGASWRKYGVTAEMVLKKNQHIQEGSAELWAFVEYIVADAVKKGYLATTEEA